MRIGAELLARVTAEAARRDLDRSAFADVVIEAALRDGLPTTVDTKLMVDALRRDDRCLLRLDSGTATKLHETAAKLGIPAATLVTFIFIGAVPADEELAA